MATGQDWNKLNWERLASYVIRGRKMAGYSTPKALSDAAGKALSYKTILRVEGVTQPVSRDTLDTIESYLHWKPGSAVAVLRGGEPQLEDEITEASESASTRREILAMTPDERAATYRKIREILGRDEAEKWQQRVVDLISAADEGPLFSPQETGREVG